MNTATKNLENDHVNILRLVDVMECMVMNCATDLSHLEAVVSLIRNFADGFHHAKEENLLFPLLVQKGFSSGQGPVAVMLREHEQGRNFVKGMSDGIAKFRQSGDLGLPEVYMNMQGYIDLLRAHIGKENTVLFPMADKVITPAEQMDLLIQFAALEAKISSNGEIEQYIMDIEALEAIYKG